MGRSHGSDDDLTRRIRETYGDDVDPKITLRGDDDETSDLSSDIVKRLTGREHPFGRYSIKGEVARGGQGAVLKVWDEDLRRNLAMKVVLGQADAEPTGDTPPVDSKTLGRFLEEAQVTGQLDHPGIVPVHELGLDASGRVYFTMKLVKGQDLSQVYELVHEGDEEWTQTRALGVLLKVCEAMAYAHHKGVIHRDLKPSNVMVGRFGAVYVMDWGIARVLDRKDERDIRIKPQLTTTGDVDSDRQKYGAQSPDSPLLTMDGDVLGTPAYMSPEQAKGQLEKVGPQTDVYSMGAMLYHLLTGQMPYVPPDAYVNNFVVLGRVQEEAPRSIHEFTRRFPVEVVAICEKAMFRDLSGRYQTMEALAGDLRAYVEGRVVRAYEAGTWAETRKWVRRNKAFAVSVFVSMLLLLWAVIASNALRRQAEAHLSQAEQSAVEAQLSAQRAMRQQAMAMENEATTRFVLALMVMERLMEDVVALPVSRETLTRAENWLARARPSVEILFPEYEDRMWELGEENQFSLSSLGLQFGSADAGRTLFAMTDGALQHVEFGSAIIKLRMLQETYELPTSFDGLADRAVAFGSLVGDVARSVNSERAQDD